MLAGYLSCRQGRTQALATALQWGAAAVQHEGTLFSPNESNMAVTVTDSVDPSRPLHDHDPSISRGRRRRPSDRTPAHDRLASHTPGAQKGDGVNLTMQAVVIHGREDYRLEQIPVPGPGPGEALVKVQAVGICASDLKCYHGAPDVLGRRPSAPQHRSAGHPWP